MRTSALSFSAFFAALVLSFPGSPSAQEKQRICEVTPKMHCLDKSLLDGKTLKFDGEATAIQPEGFTICDSSYNYVASPDIVLIMDNTGSMRKYNVVNGVARWCPNPATEPSDPGCISGDPDSLRGPALRTFLDSALVKGGKGLNVGVVLFSEVAVSQFPALKPLNDTTLKEIKDSIIMYADGQTNYYAAFNAARNLLKGSKKPPDQQFIVFVSDGRPNYPTTKQGGDPYLYKEDTVMWNHLPPVHCIFLGDNKDNYADMQEIAAHTGGSFFNITDVSKLASYLTDSLSRTLFRTARPTQTTVRNLTTKTGAVTIGPENHLQGPDSTWVLKMPGPLYLAPGLNDILIQTEYGTGGIPQTVHFQILRDAGNNGGYDSLSGKICRDRASIVLYNSATPARPISLTGDPYLITDKNLNYVLSTSAPLDSLNVVVRVKGASNPNLQDLEVVVNGPANHKDSAWSDSLPFEHQQPIKKSNDGKAQVDHGETVIVSYQNPFIPEDSAQASVKIKYGVDVVSAAYYDLDGDGRIETVRIRFLDNLGALPDSLGFAIVDARGNRSERRARPGEIAFGKNSDNNDDRHSIIISLKDPFPYGVTSVANSDSSGHTFRQDNVPLVSATFRVDDSVPPVVLSATVTPPHGSENQTTVEVIYSEPVKLVSPVVDPIVFRRDTVVFSAKQIPISRSERVNDHDWIYHLESGSDFTPVGGDYVAIDTNGVTSDTSGIVPRHRAFKSIDGGAPSQAISKFFVAFANGGSEPSGGGMETGPSGNGFIPIDSNGYALPGSANGKCQTCNPGSEGNFAGSVIVIETRQPVTYTFTIFSNLGDLVARGQGKIEESDLQYLQRERTGEYLQRIVWNGRTESGQVAGTGAYVLKADFHFEKSFKTGANPSNSTKYTRFGFLRNCCASDKTYWFDEH